MSRRARRIVYVTDGISPWIVGGMQAVARRHIGWLTEMGYDVTAIVAGAGMPASSEFVARIVSVPWRNRPPIARIDPFSYVRQLRHFSSSISTIIENVDPAVVYAEGPLVDDYLARPNAAPVIFHPHGLEMFQRTGSMLMDARNWPMRALIRRHARLACATISQGGRLDAILQGPVGAPAHRIVRLPNCMPAGFALANAPRTQQMGRFLFVGRNEGRKGLKRLLVALPHVPGSTLNVVGAFRDGMRLQSGVTLHGEVRDRHVLRRFYDNADFLVVPSLAEGMPTVIFEAFGGALPVIATDVGAVGDLVRDGESGFLVPRNNHGALVSSLRAAMSLESHAYRRLSARALQMASFDFAPQRVRGMLLDIVASVMQSPNAKHENNIQYKASMYF